MLSIPLGIGAVAERGAHNNTRTLVNCCLAVGQNGYLVIIERNKRFLADEVGIPLIFRVNKQTNTAV